MPISLCHIVCVCMHACDLDFRLNAECLFVMEGGREEVRQYRVMTKLDFGAHKLLKSPLLACYKFLCLCGSSLCLLQTQVYRSILSLAKNNWEKDPRARLARSACCSSVWHPKLLGPESFYS